MGKDYKIPFNSIGNMLPHANTSNARYSKGIWRDNTEWNDTFSFVGGYGNSHYEMLSSISGKAYYMFTSDFKQFIKHGTIQNGLVTGRFKFCKKGNAYGVVCVKGGPSTIDLNDVCQVDRFYEFLNSGVFDIEKNENYYGYYGYDNGNGIVTVIQKSQFVNDRVVECFEISFNPYGVFNPIRFMVDESRDWVEFVQNFLIPTKS